jgi:XTP/dITP diphosphohydrolase
MVLISPDKKEYIFEGSLEGTISIRAQGNEGFGYDPVFIPTGYEKTMSELGLSIKNKISHRSQALKNLREFLLTQTQQVESTLSND